MKSVAKTEFCSLLTASIAGRSVGNMPQATAASADNRSSSEKEQVVPFVYSFKTNGPVREVFGPAFQIKIKKLLNSQWLNRRQ